MTAKRITASTLILVASMSQCHAQKNWKPPVASPEVKRLADIIVSSALKHERFLNMKLNRHDRAVLENGFNKISGDKVAILEGLANELTKRKVDRDERVEGFSALLVCYFIDASKLSQQSYGFIRSDYFGFLTFTDLGGNNEWSGRHWLWRGKPGNRKLMVSRISPPDGGSIVFSTYAYLLDMTHKGTLTKFFRDKAKPHSH